MFAEKFSNILADKIDAGQTPWRKPAQCAPAITCAGLERLSLNFRASGKGYTDDRWMSKEAAESAGYKIKDGERGVVIALKSAERAQDGSYSSDIKDSHRVLYNGSQLDGIEPRTASKLPFDPVVAAELQAEISKMSGSPGGRLSAELAAFNLASKYDGITVPDLLTEKDLVSVSMHLRSDYRVLLQASMNAHLAANNVEHRAEQIKSEQARADHIEIKSLTVWRTDEIEYGYRATIDESNFRVGNNLSETELKNSLGDLIATAAIDKLEQTGVYSERLGRTTTSISAADAGVERLSISREAMLNSDDQSSVSKVFAESEMSNIDLESLIEEPVDLDSAYEEIVTIEEALTSRT